MTELKHETREQWLKALVDGLKPILREQGKTCPDIRISCGWPATGGTRNKGRRIGECWVKGARDKIQQIYISPLLEDPAEVGHVTLHELCHAVLPDGTGHKAPFARLAKALGLEGKPTATVAGDALNERIKGITDELGPYPHVALDLSGRKKQTTRLLKVVCPSCGYTIRTTATWLDTGMPICPCGEQMVDAEDIDEEPPFKVVSSRTEYATHDDRFHLMFSQERKRQTWHLIDYTTGKLISVSDREDALDTIDSILVGLFDPEHQDCCATCNDHPDMFIDDDDLMHDCPTCGGGAEEVDEFELAAERMQDFYADLHAHFESPHAYEEMDHPEDQELQAQGIDEYPANPAGREPAEHSEAAPSHSESLEEIATRLVTA